MIRIGITGGYGSGKSTAARYFEEKNYPVIYADPLAKKLMTDDSGVRKELISLLGNKTYNADGRLNKEHVASVIFSEPGKKQALERIVHPAVLAAVADFFSEIESKQSPKMAFVEAALIFESKMDRMLDYVIAVTAPEDIRVKRIMERDGTDDEEIRKRIHAQHSDEYLKTRADFIVENSGDIDSLQQRCVYLENIFLAMEQ